jgi:maltooligosyltrehalose trehalohydrolase
MIPMLFMGEEWGSKAPFPFFCDFHGDLAEAVRKGRHKEFAGAYARYGDHVPDPLDPSTFQSAVLDWDARNEPAGRKRLALVRDLLAARAAHIIPRLAGACFGAAQAADNGLLTANWRMGDGAKLQLRANLSASEIVHPRETQGILIWGDEASDRLPPWSVFWRLEAR